MAKVRFMPYYLAKRRKPGMKDTEGNIYQILSVKGSSVIIQCIESKNRNLVGAVRELKFN